uniref:V-type proton ATPase subunit G n=1 Tax=Rhizochromulina marina TaxID=1034831 RepID=A0A7S2RMV1_9STRA|mmetsp:Transcript_18455/g.53888  ORF Transcript_18455/g.53888 Transcript_18455/m.53888 type:complete len:106 (+) Transcript_18455:53-370(+)|eukprot:CAMPEP_0118965370 /NCGR_PEP_ID=MMETSP1173-20130426/2948_1 /TAXON_ID=1034831 /ORGANISM="Rhizochromulina marina cf, Strain CCMP1243" /LENGTH=105 /DNA_ID=CAMNT_0006913977 /DNA_START=53 /DNA_END=370 /DNA_ORIENTATION=-
MSSMNGIQELIAAETKATAIVQEQRQAKVERMKQAKVEAKQVVDGYRGEKDAAFEGRSAELQVGDEFAALEAQTQQEIAQMRSDFATNKESVAQMLLQHVTSVKN